MKKTLFSIAFLLLVLYSAHAQNRITNENSSSVLPVSPEAGSLGKFATIPVSKYTGIPDISIPLHSIKKGDINVNIALSYHSGGNKVDEIASRTGLGWALNAGGSITRSVRGLPDDILTQSDLKRFLNNQMQTPERLNYMYNVNAGLKDAEPDLYYLTLNDQSLKIFKGNDDEWVTMPKNENIQIKENIDGYDWIITDGKGIVYKFKDRELSDNTSIVHRDRASSNDGPYFGGITSWLLTEIEDVKGNKVNFFYNSFIQNFITKGGESISVSQTLNDYRCETFNQFTEVRNVILGKRLSSIVYSDGRIKFITKNEQRVDLPGDSSLKRIEIYNSKELIKGYQLFTSYFFNNSTGKNTPNVFSEMDDFRLRLDSLREESTSGSLKAHEFYYYDAGGLAVRNSNAQDHWGYFNGKDNQGTSVSYVDLGFTRGAIKTVDHQKAKETILAKIVFPTGGSVEYEYEGNKYAVDKLKPNENGTQQLIGSLSGVNNGPLGTGNGLDYYFEKEFVIPNEYLSGGPLKVFSFPTVDGVSIDCSCSVRTRVRYPDGTSLDLRPGAEEIFYLNVAGTYKLIIEITTEFEGNPRVAANMKLEAVLPSTGIGGPADVNGPGLRIRKIKRIFSPGDEVITYYEYNDPLTGLSSGRIANVPEYSKPIKHKNKEILDPEHNIGQLYSCDYIVYSSSSNYNLINTKNSYIGYTVVTVLEDVNGTNGKSTYKYSYVDDYNAISNFPFPPNSPQDWKRGVLLEEVNYKKNGDIYELSNRKINGYTIIPGSTYTTRGLKMGSNTIYTYPVSNEVIVNELAIMTYDLGSDAYLLKSDTLIVKDAGQELRTINNYNYSANNYQLSSIFTLGSEGKQRNRYLFYPADYRLNKDSSPLLSQMLKNNMVDVLIEEINAIGTGTSEKITSASVYEYDFLTSPAGSRQTYLKSIYDADLSLANLSNRYNFINLPAHYYERLSTPLVNKFSQPLFRKINGFQKISYVWSYNGQYPIAEIRNADYSVIESVLGGNVNVSNFSNRLNPPNDSIAIFLAPLRNNLALKDASITSFSYKPGIGVVSQTDAKNFTTSYLYDNFQRLKHIKDHQGYIVKSFDYGYAKPIKIYYNIASEWPFRKNNCSDPGTIGTLMKYSIPARKHSATSQQAVDALVLADVNANGQNYANSFGTCGFEGNVIFEATIQPVNSTSFSVDFLNLSTNITYRNTIAEGGALPSIPAGRYNVYINALDQSDRYTVKFNGDGFSLEPYDTVTINNVVLFGTVKLSIQ